MHKLLHFQWKSMYELFWSVSTGAFIMTFWNLWKKWKIKCPNCLTLNGRQCKNNWCSVINIRWLWQRFKFKYLYIFFKGVMNDIPIIKTFCIMIYINIGNYCPALILRRALTMITISSFCFLVDWCLPISGREREREYCI